MLTFGTSGLRGLVAEFDRASITRWTMAFLRACPPNGLLYVGRDLRPSSPRIADVIMQTAQSAGIDTVDCGALPTPALALAACGASAIMVTGSHIPADRNGLKFYVPSGEITKAEEAAIAAAYAGLPDHGARSTIDGGAAYLGRYVQAFGETALTGLRLGVYQHSSVARDIMTDLLTRLGASVVPLARSDDFIPVDTEAVDAATRDMLAGWCADHELDGIVSTDGDADRPMLTDANGKVIPGDILGIMTAQSLNAGIVVTPVSSNSMVTEVFREVELTRIGSPYVIAGITNILGSDPYARVVGFEANGGFLLGFDAQGPAGLLHALMTRDSLLPIIAPLAATLTSGKTLAERIATLPPRVTAADRLQQIDRAKAGAFLDRLSSSTEARKNFLEALGREEAIDHTDGLRLTLDKERVVHLRPSGNAPEFRVYVEAATGEQASALLERAMGMVRAEIG